MNAHFQRLKAGIPAPQPFTHNTIAFTLIQDNSGWRMVIASHHLSQWLETTSLDIEQAREEAKQIIDTLQSMGALPPD